MIIKIMVKAGSSKQQIECFGDNHYLIYLKEPAENNRANKELINLLSRHFCTPVGKIKIKSGLLSMQKMIELM